MAEDQDWKAGLAAFGRMVGVDLADFCDEKVIERLEKNREKYAQLRKVPLDYGAEPAFAFRPGVPPSGPSSFALTRNGAPAKPDLDTDLAFLSATELGLLVESKQVSPVELTRLYLDRLSGIGSKLCALVTLTEDRALKQAKAAEVRQAKGERLSVLDGVPWGAKDLLATRGYPTTWGATPFRDQVIDLDAAVVEKLDAAGGILVGKLSLGALASGPTWFGGTTKNPWDLEEDSSGSSAGPGAATAAGLVGFSIGSETQGSITSPSTRCGVTGLRPTYGRVSRYGAMALSWTMDKLGPMCRTVEDCAAVFSTVHGTDSRDASSVDAPFVWPAEKSIEGLRIGLVKDSYDGIEDKDLRTVHDEAARALADLGAEFGEWTAPDLPADAVEILLATEAAASFDQMMDHELSLSELAEADKSNWPRSFVVGMTVPAVVYLRAMRVRRRLIDAWERSLAPFDVILSPGNGSKNCSGANLTGHPSLTLKCGMLKGKPISMTYIGHLYDESTLLAAGLAFERATEWHRMHPTVET